ncbi:hypothetical protein H5410_013295, partial [Solanum commersonii]
MSNKERLENNTESSGGNTNNLLYKKIACFTKKAHELSTLCDAQLGIVIFSPIEEILWPTENQAKERFENYLSFDLDTRKINLETQESSLDKKMKAQEKNIRKMEQEMRRKKWSCCLMKLLMERAIWNSMLENLKKEDQPIKGNDNNIEEKNDSIPKIIMF